MSTRLTVSPELPTKSVPAKHVPEMSLGFLFNEMKALISSVAVSYCRVTKAGGLKRVFRISHCSMGWQSGLGSA